ncbi:hypothetical protein, partial [Streptomyces sp. NPDC056242]|uniref:hypothetical protein n=1 Tax=Streptomyces sp. NPDC056242 TaxID=3345760 RepID=UPI0035E086C5
MTAPPTSAADKGPGLDCSVRAAFVGRFAPLAVRSGGANGSMPVTVIALSASVRCGRARGRVRRFACATISATGASGGGPLPFGVAARWAGQDRAC